MALIDQSFFQQTFLPLWDRLFLQSSLEWLNVVSDALFALAYFLTFIVVIIFIRKRADIHFKGIFILFALFVLFCSITHIMSILHYWQDTNGLHAGIKILTAIIALVVAYLVFKKIDDAIKIPTRKEFKRALEKAASEELKVKQYEIEKRGQELFKFTTELLPSGLLVIDESQNIVMANAALCKIFGYNDSELLGKNLSLLIDKNKAYHATLVNNYIQAPKKEHQMFAGRVVRGVHKNGSLVDIQINLTVHEYGGEKLTFAVVTDFGTFLYEQEEKNEFGNRLSRALDASGDGIWEWNVQTNNVWYSAKLMEIIGHDFNKTNKLEDWLDHIHPEDRVKVNDALEKHFLDKAKYDVTYRGMTASGQYEWFRARGDTIFDHNGQAILMSGLLSNINETKVLEGELAEKSKFLNEVLQRSLTGLYIYDLEHQAIVYVNPEYTNLTGYGLEELNSIQKDRDLLSLYHADDRAKVQMQRRALIESGEEGTGIEYRFRHKSGEWQWLYSRESIYSVSSDGKPKELLGSLFNITELKQREYEIRKLAIDYSTTFEQAGVGIAHINIDYSFIKANAKFLEIFYYTTSQQYELDFIELCDNQDRDSLRTLIDRLIASRETLFHVEKRFLRSTGESFWADLTVSLVHSDTSDANDYLIVILEDISQRKLMEQSLAESNVALERFAYSASHDLQEPLRKISAFSGALERRLNTEDQDPEVIFQLERICDASVRMGKMIDNLLKLSRASSTTLTIYPISLSSLIVLALDDLFNKIHTVDISVILEKDVMISVDSNAFGQVLRNLISNSIMYRSSQPKIEIYISWKCFEKSIVITYQDNGIGIPPEKIEIIFEPFRRLVGKNIPGTGMGLTICKQIMRAHNGRISAISQEGKGAIFEIELPHVSNTKH